jgi:hypothetical protein
MENMTFNNGVDTIAEHIDHELTMIERMKIKKSTTLRIGSAFCLYITTMIVFSLFL